MSTRPTRAPLAVLWRSRLADDIARASAPELADLALEVVTDPDEAAARMDGVEVLVDGRPDGRLLDGPALRRVVVPYAGIAAELREEVRARPHLKLHNSHFNAPFVAQHAVALLLACANRVGEADRALRRGDWGPRYDDAFLNVQLSGKRALLVGYGAIGRELEPRLRGLGMEVAALRRQPDPAAPLPQFGIERAAEAFAAADVAVVSLPGTPATEGLIGPELLAAMPDGALLVNVGRGSVIDARALYDALREGRLAGAGLDVWWRYPESDEARAATPPADPPLHELPNVVASPHRANQVAGWEEASFRDVLETLRALRRGEERNLVDAARGY